MPEDYKRHNLAYFLDFDYDRGSEIQGHHLLNCYLPAEDHEQLHHEVGEVA